MQAGLVCEYIASRWGQKGLEAVLKEYGAGRTRRGAQGNAQDLGRAVRRGLRELRRQPVGNVVETSAVAGRAAGGSGRSSAGLEGRSR
jgi:hypothetical protein